MKKKNKLIVLFSAIAALAFGLAGCGELTKLQSYQEKGYVVSVTYDANGGIFEYDKKISIMDLYNPSNYEADAEGTVQIRLTAPEDPVRTQPGKEDLTLTYSDHFLTGWYQKRELKLVNGYPVDEKGNLLFEYNAEDEIYYYVLADENGLPMESVRARTEKDENSVEKYFDAEGYVLLKIEADPEVEDSKEYFLRLGKIDENGKVVEGVLTQSGEPEQGQPAYVYSQRWDFENDTLSYNEKNGKFKELTLYAGWSQFFEFNYYYKVEGEEGDWTKHSATYTFDYKTVQENEAYDDLDTVVLPTWKDGKMTHTSSYKSGETYMFPSVEGKTFLAAYSDPECKNKIKTSYTHEGTLDAETGEAINRVQNVYFVVEPVERYKIETAKQFVKNVNLSGHYEILNDLDFSDMDWPAAFMKGTFTGQIYAANGGSVKFSNINATYVEGGSQGGLFGRIANGAVLKDVHFENTTVSLEKISYNAAGATYGMFAGTIDSGVTISNVSVDGLFRIGNVGSRDNNNYEINLLANGNKSALEDSLSKISLQIYGEFKAQTWRYAVDPLDENSVKVNTATGNITLILKECKDANYLDSYDIIKIENGGNQQ